MTTITIVGRATEDAALRYTSGGKAVAEVSIADNHRRKDGNEWVDDGVTYYKVTAWEHLAEEMADKIRRGMRVIVVGELRNREYETRDGSKGRSLEIRAYEIGPALDKYAPRDAAASTRTQGDADVWGNGGVDDGSAPF